MEKKFYMCFVDTKEAFNRVSRKMIEWTIIEKSFLEVMIQAIVSLNDEAKTRVRVGSAYSEESEVKIGVLQGFVLQPLWLAIVVDGIIKNPRKNVINGY